MPPQPRISTGTAAPSPKSAAPPVADPTQAQPVAPINKFGNELIPIPTEPIMSKAARRKLKNPDPVITPQEKEQMREELRELRKSMRRLKSNGGRAKIRKELRAQKREREEEEFDGYHFDEKEMRVITEEEAAVAPKKKKQRQEPAAAAKPAPTSVTAQPGAKKYPGIVVPRQVNEW
jgi:hypothetical protein